MRQGEGLGSTCCTKIIVGCRGVSSSLLCFRGDRGHPTLFDQGSSTILFYEGPVFCATMTTALHSGRATAEEVQVIQHHMYNWGFEKSGSHSIAQSIFNCLDENFLLSLS
jgi:hypothetical protein